MAFIVSGSYGKDDLRALQHAVRSRNFSKTRRSITRIVRIVLGAALLFVGVRGAGFMTEEAAPQGVQTTMVIPVLLLLIVGAYLLVRGITNRSFIGEWLTWRNYPGKTMVLTYRFGDEEFGERLGESEQSFAYSTIETVYEDDGRFFLFINKQSAHLLKKSDFTQGSPEDFRGFIAEKTGCSIQTVD